MTALFCSCINNSETERSQIDSSSANSSTVGISPLFTSSFIIVLRPSAKLMPFCKNGENNKNGADMDHFVLIYRRVLAFMWDSTSFQSRFELFNSTLCVMPTECRHYVSRDIAFSMYVAIFIFF